MGKNCNYWGIFKPLNTFIIFGFDFCKEFLWKLNPNTAQTLEFVVWRKEKKTLKKRPLFCYMGSLPPFLFFFFSFFMSLSTLEGWHQLATTLITKAMLPSLLLLELEFLANQFLEINNNKRKGKRGYISLLLWPSWLWLPYLFRIK